MSWFEHRHWWYRESSHEITPTEKGAHGMLVYESCRCGAVRTIEIVPGQDPVIHYATA